MAIGYTQVSLKLWAIFSFGILITAFLWQKIKPEGNVKYLLFFLFLFLQLGFISTKTKHKIPQGFITKDIYLFQCEIVELDRGDKNWNKGIAEIQQIFTQDQNSIILKENLLIYTDKKTSGKLGPGDIVLIESQIQKIQNKGNPGEFDALYYWKSKSVNYMSFFTESDYAQIKDAKIKIKNALKSGIIKSLKKNVAPEHLGIVKALFLGDKSSLEQEMRQSFSAAGAMHLLAQSHLKPADHEHTKEKGNLLDIGHNVDKDKATIVDLPAGGVLFHHCQTLHYTPPNNTNRQRRAFAIHFMPPGTRRPPSNEPLDVSFSRPLLRMRA